MVAVVDLDAGAGLNRGERIRDRPQLRGELFVRQPGHDQLSADEGHVGDRISARVAAHLPGRGCGRVGQRRLAVLQLVESDRFQLPFAVHAHERRLGIGSLAAHHRDEGVLRLRMNREVGHGNRCGVGSEQRPDLAVNALYVLRAWRAPSGRRAQLERVDGRPLRISREEHVVRPERQRPNRLQRRRGVGRTSRRRRHRGQPGGGHHQYCQSQSCFPAHSFLLNNLSEGCDRTPKWAVGLLAGL